MMVSGILVGVTYMGYGLMKLTVPSQDEMVSRMSKLHPEQYTPEMRKEREEENQKFLDQLHESMEDGRKYREAGYRRYKKVDE